MKPAASLDSVEKASKYHVDNPTTSTSSFTKKFPVVALKGFVPNMVTATAFTYLMTVKEERAQLILHVAFEGCL